MLTSLLPGFRHLRTPFTLGVLIAFQLWILIGDHIPSRSEAEGFLERLYGLGDVVGRAAITAAISFLLYLVGDIARLTSTQMLGIIRVSPRWITSLSSQSRHELQDFASRAFISRPNASVSEIGGLTQKMVMEFAEIRMRLIANHLDVYMEHDRYDSEADFRMNVGFYSIPLWPIIAWNWTAWLLFGALASAALFSNGLRARREANSILVQAIVSGIVESRYYKDEVERDFPTGASNVTITRRPSTR
ncbi:hypothetical protein [Streptomyces sp. CB02488]|uniref:hypothetical protein n=1 Tax=Streptomyces sp. CB02488 TaxID=1703920 RepID=UPI001161258E|nr:hypothetical protein [Streptomyces sp. CB02488]